MSDAHTLHPADDSHEGLIKTPKQLIWTVIAAFVVPVVLALMLANYVATGKKPGAGSDSMSEEAVARRLMRVGTVEIRGEAGAAVLRTGEQVYTAQCAACHASGAANAPKLGDEGAWAARVKTGYDALLNSALKGKGAMAAQGGGDYSDFEIGRAVVYMANKAGGKLAEPQAPAAAGATGAAAPAAPAAAPAEPAAAPAAAAADKPAGDGSRVESSAGLVKLYFATGSATLPTQAESALAKLSEEVKAGGKSVVISGFHDSRGSAQKNAELAKQRAFSVRDMLIAVGVAQDKITLKKPENTTGSGDAAQARRVEVAVQ
jgi:cytochrome c5